MATNTAKQFGQSSIASTAPGRKSLLERIVSTVTQKFRTSARTNTIEALNPLHGLTAYEAQNIFDFARQGNYARLQYVYGEIERTDPTLLVCVTRRKAAVSELDWKVVRSDQRLHAKDVTEVMEKEQIEFLETLMARIDNLPEAMEHLSLAAFRGFSHILPIWGDADKLSIRRFQLPNTWNFCFDRYAQEWLWNASADSFIEPKVGANGLVTVPACERVTVVDGLAIDWPALIIFLRKSMGERNWGRFLEQFGIPPVIITMPDITSPDEEGAFLEGAKALFEGRSGVVPFGTQISWATEGRGNDPYASFLEYQSRQIVLMATGGILTSLAESGSGTLGGNAHAETWRQVARRYVRIISNAVNKQLCEPIMRRRFPGQPILAEFKLETEPDLTAAQVLDLAGKARAAGFTMDETELSEQTGFTIRRDATPQMGGVSSAGIGLGIGNSAPKTAHGEVILNEDKAADVSLTKMTPEERLANALQADYAEIAKRIQEILAMAPEERAKAAEELAKDLPNLIPDDPLMASVIAEEMEKAFEAEARKDGVVEVEN